MRAFDVLLALYRLDMRQGKDYLEAPKKNDLELNVIEGKLKRNHWYWCDFYKQPMRRTFGYPHPWWWGYSIPL